MGEPNELEIEAAQLARSALAGGYNFRQIVQAVERQTLIASLRNHDGVALRSAYPLGLHRNTHTRQVKACGVNVRAIRRDCMAALAKKKQPQSAGTAAVERKVG